MALQLVVEKVIPIAALRTEARVGVTYVQPYRPPERIWFDRYDISPKKFKPGDTVAIDCKVVWWPPLHKDGTLEVTVTLHVADKSATLLSRKVTKHKGDYTETIAGTAKIPDFNLYPGEYAGKVVFVAVLSW